MCPARKSSRKFNRLFERVVANQVKWSLPIWVVTPLTALCRAPVSSTVTQRAVSSRSQHADRLVAKAFLARGQEPDDVALGDAQAEVV